jgi:L-threonylcarbamoyladenylate synthase
VEQLRSCAGWENVVVGYKDGALAGAERPRAPGMKYRHYSPKARVVLFEAGAGGRQQGRLHREAFLERARGYRSVGVIRTKTWPLAMGLDVRRATAGMQQNGSGGQETEYELHGPFSRGAMNGNGSAEASPFQSNLLKSLIQHQIPHAEHLAVTLDSRASLDVWDISLGVKTESVARGLFSALRELDKKGVEAIFVEGIDDTAGDDIAAAVMNRLRKAAEVKI